MTDENESMPDFDVSKVVVSLSEYGPWQIGFLDLDNDSKGSLAGEILRDLKVAVARSIADGWPVESYYLPAARSGIAQSHKVLAAALVRQSSRIGLEQFNIPTLPGMTTEFLGNLLSLDRRLVPPNELAKAIHFIESDVLGGTIDLDESAGLPTPEIVYMQGDADHPSGKYTLEHTSSMISELAPVVLFLKYLVQPGDLLIFEEPESHLHPAAQRQLARGIARLVNTGVKVIITTHSDTFVSQINNLLALSQASKDLVAERGFEAADLLRQEQVGAYLFRYSQELGGSVMIPLEIDPDTGIDEEEFAEVFESLYDESIALQRDRA